jgi:hypothetical protein
MNLNIVEDLTAACPVQRTSPNAAPVYDVIQSFMLTGGSSASGGLQPVGVPCRMLEKLTTRQQLSRTRPAQS